MDAAEILLMEASDLLARAESLMDKTQEAVQDCLPGDRTLKTIQVILEVQTLTQVSIAKTLLAIAETV